MAISVFAEWCIWNPYMKERKTDLQESQTLYHYVGTDHVCLEINKLANKAEHNTLNANFKNNHRTPNHETCYVHPVGLVY